MKCRSVALSTILVLFTATSLAAAPTPTFSEPVTVVAWLLGHSGHGFDPMDDTATASVFSPGLRAALRASVARSRQRREPPCGADGDIIRDTQEDGTPGNVKLSVQGTGHEATADRRTVSASFDVDGYHRDRRFMVVLLDGSWKLENIVETNGTSLRRSLRCR